MRLLLIIGVILTSFNCTLAEDFNDSVETERSSSRKAFLLQIDGIIGPATTDYFERSLDKADTASTEFILLRMDTPGGLDLSMRKIIKKIISSPVPVVSYVSPGGSRAASAGTYILYASHVAAMAPATNLGAATPVQMLPTGKFGEEETDNNNKPDNKENKEQKPQIQDPLTKKIINDAVAYIQGLAKMRGRNEEWAEQAVRSAASLSAEDALKKMSLILLRTVRPICSSNWMAARLMFWVQRKP